MSSQIRPPGASQYAPSRSRISISSEATTVAGGGRPLANGDGHRYPHTATENAPSQLRRPGQYNISSVLVDPDAPASLLPTLPSLSSNAYLPTSISSLGTTFTSAGTLPRSSASSKSVAQRRSQAPPIVVSEVRKVVRSEFDDYLNEVGPAWERWQKESRLGREGTADLREGGVGLGLGAVNGGVEGNRSRGGKEEELPPLDGVPQIFFDPAFNLSNPRTFDLVTERIQLTPSNSPQLRAADADERDPLDTPSQGPAAFDSIPGLGPLTLNDLATDQILQEKLSHYTAVIESHLVREIGLRSSSFFSALSNLQSLHQQGEDTLVKIAELQAALSKEEKGVGGSAKRGLEILRGQARRRGLEKIEESVRAVEEIWSGVEDVRGMVEHGEWVGALEVSEQIEALYHGSAEGGHSTTPNTAIVLSPSSNSDPATPSTASSSKLRSRHASKLNLTRVKALDGVPKKLALFRAQVAKSLESELIGVLEHEMEVGVEDYRRLSKQGTWKGKAKEGAVQLFSPSSTTGRSVASFVASPVAMGAEEIKEGEAGEEIAKERAKERVRPVVRGLVRAEGLDGAVAAWRESALREVRAMVREHLPTNETPTVDEEDQFAQLAVRSVSRASIDLNSISEKSISLAKKLRAMPHADFLQLAQETYLGLLGCIEVVDIHAHVLNELASETRAEERIRKSRRRPNHTKGDDSTPTTPNGTSLSVPGSNDDRPSLSLATLPEMLERPASPSSTSDDAVSTDISDVVHAIAELANLRFSKVIGVRTEVHAALSLAEFVEIFDASWAFVLQCEVICQRMIVGLRGVMVGQAKTFLQTFHQKRLTDSARFVEEEQWVAADVKPYTQSIVDLLLQGAVGDPKEFLLGQRLRDKGVLEAPAVFEGEEGASAKQVDIEGRRYFAVSAGLTALEVLADYIKVIVNCPLLTTDAMSKVVEFMKSFNSRTCQVVLGAGAMRSAGLKNITAKHLALASQALSIMISLIPYIRETVRRHLNAKQAIMLIEFDKLKRDYQEHQNEIHAKLVAIMSDRLQVHCRTLESIDWEQPGPKPEGPNTYMEGLVKENITLHKVLSRFLQSETVDFIMGQVFAALDARLKDEYGRIEVKSSEARKRLLADAVYLRTKLGELKGMEGRAPGQDLEPLILSKPVPDAPRPATARRTSSTMALFSSPSSPALAPSPAAPVSEIHSARTSFDTPDLSALPSPSVTPAPPSPAIEQPLPALPDESPSLPAAIPEASISPPPLPPVVAPPPEISLSAPDPPKKRSLAERLADMARKPRGSAAPTAAPVPAPAPEVVVASAPAQVDPKSEPPPPVAADSARTVQAGAGEPAPAVAEPTRVDNEEDVAESAAEELVPPQAEEIETAPLQASEDVEPSVEDAPALAADEPPVEEDESVEDAVDAVLDEGANVVDADVEGDEDALAEELDAMDPPGVVKEAAVTSEEGAAPSVEGEAVESSPTVEMQDELPSPVLRSQEEAVDAVEEEDVEEEESTFL